MFQCVPQGAALTTMGATILDHEGSHVGQITSARDMTIEHWGPGGWGVLNVCDNNHDN